MQGRAHSLTTRDAKSGIELVECSKPMQSAFCLPTSMALQIAHDVLRVETHYRKASAVFAKEILVPDWRQADAPGL